MINKTAIGNQKLVNGRWSSSCSHKWNVDSLIVTIEKAKFNPGINNIIENLAHLKQFKQINQMVKTM